ncbi:MAG: hypothetical protein HRT66_11525 [Flavobacteriaceae bacterium]|nr:hypothetical protein [Flavobacteriaceae bacterium]
MKKTYFITAILIAVFGFTSCSDEDPEVYGNILTFAVDGANINLSGQDVTISLPFGTDISALKATIELSENATIEPASGTASTYVELAAKEFVVTSKDGDSKTYNVKVDLRGEEASGAKLTSHMLTNPGGYDLTYTYEYGDNGFMSSSKMIKNNTIYNTEYSYDSKNRLIRSVITPLGSEEEEVRVFTYGSTVASAYIVSSVTTISEKDTYEYTYTYDTNGYLNKMTRKDLNEEGDAGDVIHTYTYSDVGNMLSSTLDNTTYEFVFDDKTNAFSSLYPIAYDKVKRIGPNNRTSLPDPSSVSYTYGHTFKDIKDIKYITEMAYTINSGATSVTEKFTYEIIKSEEE